MEQDRNYAIYEHGGHWRAFPVDEILDGIRLIYEELENAHWDLGEVPPDWTDEDVDRELAEQLQAAAEQVLSGSSPGGMSGTVLPIATEEDVAGLEWPVWWTTGVLPADSTDEMIITMMGRGMKPEAQLRRAGNPSRYRTPRTARPDPTMQALKRKLMR